MQIVFVTLGMSNRAFLVNKEVVMVVVVEVVMYYFSNKAFLCRSIKKLPKECAVTSYGQQDKANLT